MPEPDTPRLCRVAGRRTWHIYFRRRRISTGCTDRTEAESVLAKYLAGLHRPAAGKTLSVSEILDLYLTDRRSREIPGVTRIEWAHRPLRRFWGDKPPEAITEEACLAYVKHRAKERSGPHSKAGSAGTARTELQALRAALRWAADKPRKLIHEAPLVHMPPRPPARERWLTRAEAAALLKACSSPHVRLFVCIALMTGARAAAILGLTWDRVYLERRLIDFRAPGKPQTRKRRVAVPINDTLLAELRTAQAGSTVPWVIEYGGKRVGSVKHAIARAAAKAGLRGVSPHVFRHTAATWMVQEGVPLWEVAGMLGNTVEMVQDTYGHQAPEHLRRAAGALG